MNVVERTKLLLSLLEQRDFMMVDEIAELSQVSKATIRRDLQMMEAKGIVKRFRGGVSLKDRVIIEEDAQFHERMTLNLDVKKRIAERATGLIEDGDVIFLDSGSTTYNMIEAIHAKDIHVVTNGLRHAVQLCSQNIPTFLLGGDILPESTSMYSDYTVSILDTMNFDKAFLGVNGVDGQVGYTSTNKDDALMKAAVLKRAAVSYVLADKEKMRKRKFFTFASLKEAVCISDASSQDFDWEWSLIETD